MPSCDGANCGACACDCSVDAQNLKAIKRELKELKAKLSRVIKRNKELEKIVKQQKTAPKRPLKRKKSSNKRTNKPL